MIDFSLREILALASIILTIVLLLTGMRILQYLVQRLAFARDVELPVVVETLQKPFRVVVALVGARITFGWADYSVSNWMSQVSHVLTVVQIAAVAWLAIAAVQALEIVIVDRYTKSDDPNDVGVRRSITQISLMRRLVVAFIVIIATAVALMSFGSFRTIGAGLLASAGIISVVVGIAAQATLGNVFAGMHLAFSNILKVNDIVVVAGETGQVDEITLTTVVVHIWNDRRLILPTSFFKENPFENWTRSGPRIGADVFLDVAFTAPVADLRAELQRYLSAHPDWDGREGVLWVSDLSGGRMRLRIAVTTASTDTLWALLNDVREHMVNYLVKTAPQSVLQFRGEGAYPEMS